MWQLSREMFSDASFRMSRIILPVSTSLSFIKIKNKSDGIKYFGLSVFTPALPIFSRCHPLTLIHHQIMWEWSLKPPNSFLFSSDLSPTRYYGPPRLWDINSLCPPLRTHLKHPQKRTLSVRIIAIHSARCLEKCNKYLLK